MIRMFCLFIYTDFSMTIPGKRQKMAGTVLRCDSVEIMVLMSCQAGGLLLAAVPSKELPYPGTVVGTECEKNHLQRKDIEKS